jgi:hypothetical protein
MSVAGLPLASFYRQNQARQKCSPERQRLDEDVLVSRVRPAAHGAKAI